MSENFISGLAFVLLGAGFIVANRFIARHAAAANSKVVSWILKRNITLQEAQYRVPFILTGTAFMIFGVLVYFDLVRFRK